MKHHTQCGALALIALLVATVLVGGGPTALMGAVHAEPVLPDEEVAVLESPELSATVESFWAISDNNTTGASLAVDANGGVHAAMSGYTAIPDTSIYPVYYGYCASGCADAAHWQWAIIGQVGVGASDIGVVRLALDSQGRPRLMWFYLASPRADRGTWHYAECNANCSQAGSWTDYAVVDVNPLGSPGEGRYFALDHLGRPHFVYLDLSGSHKGTFHAFCNANCANGGEWREYRLNEGYQYNSSLVFTSSGLARLAYRTGDYLAYYENLDGGNTWSGGFFFDLGYDASFSLRLDSQDRPRLAIYNGYRDGGADDDRLSYAWCQDGCDAVANWTAHDLGLPEDYGKDVDLVIDAQDRPHLAYYAGGEFGLGYANCTSGCETASPRWQAMILDSADHLEQVARIPDEQGCKSNWLYVGLKPSLAVDRSGNVHVGYDSEHFQGITCYPHKDITLVRLAVIGSGGGGPDPNQSKRLYLPTVRKR